jgi:arylsulfatase A-like enzyme
MGEEVAWVDGWLRIMEKDSSVTVTTPEWSLLYAVEPGVSELFHLSSDPKQEKNVINEHPKVAQELHQQLVKFMRETNVPASLLKTRLELR